MAEARLEESSIYVLETRFPTGNRDFCFFLREPEDGMVPLHPLRLLELARVDRLILNLSENQPSLGLGLALSRLLMPCLQFSGSGRHLVIEQWSSNDLRGESLPVDTHTHFARELSATQKAEWQLIRSDQKLVEGSMAELFWATQTALPALQGSFDDPELGRFAQALYQHLVPAGEEATEVSARDIKSRIRKCQQSGFTQLDLDVAPRELNILFNRMLSVAVHWCCQLTGVIAEQIVRLRLSADAGGGSGELSGDERAMLAFRYGTCPRLGNLNVGLLDGNGPLIGGLVNYLYVLHAMGAPADERDAAAACLHKCLHLLRSFQRQRRFARAQERRENRQRHTSDLDREVRQADDEVDVRAVSPEQSVVAQAEIAAYFAKIIPKLRKSDARRFQAFVDAGGDRGSAAEALGISLTKFSRQWRQTTGPNLREAKKQFDLEDERKNTTTDS